MEALYYRLIAAIGAIAGLVIGGTWVSLVLGALIGVALCLAIRLVAQRQS